MSHLVKPHVVSVAVVTALILIVIIWPSDDEPVVSLSSPSQQHGLKRSDLQQQESQQNDSQQKDNRPESETPSPSVLPMPSIQVLQPDPGLSQEALFQQAVNARKCRDVPKTQRKLNDWLSRASANHETPERITRIKNAFESCKNIDAAYDYMTSFKLLARQGNEQALWQFWQLTEEEVFRLKGIRKTDSDAIIAARQEFQLTKYQLAEQQLLLGSERAMMRLMNAYRYLDPQTGTQNYVRSLALANLIMKLSNNQDNYRRAGWLKQHLEQHMSTKEEQQAMELADEFVNLIAAS